MRLGIQLLNIGATLNDYDKKSFIEFAQGETVDVIFQLVNLDNAGLRYMPAAGCTVFVEIPRYPEYFGTISNQRTTSDYSVRRMATQAFADDRSIWKLSLSALDTSNMMSSNMRVTVTEGGKISIALLPQALKVIRSEG